MRRLKKAAAIVCAAAMLMLSDVPQMAAYASVNDPKYDSYVNMNVSPTGHPKYVVPNLYRGDAAYSNVKVYPLVVSGGVDYVPVDLFAQFPYLDVSYSRIGYGFYISNTRSGKYIAFDLDSGTTSTNDLLSVDIDSAVFYSTNYVPAGAVCAVLGLRFESYDDEENGIRAARVSGTASNYTLRELVIMYSPVKRTDESPTPGSSPNTLPEGNAPAVGTAEDPAQISKPPVKADDTPDDAADAENDRTADEKQNMLPKDPFKTAAPQQIYLVIDAAENGSVSRMTDVLEQNGRRALFLVSLHTDASVEDCRAEAAAIREILTGGHELGLSFAARDEQGALRSGEDIVAELEAKNTQLLLYGKRKTRFIHAASDRSALVQNGTAALLEEHGFTLLPEMPRFAAGTPAKAVAERICGNAPHIARSVGICLPIGAETTLEECLALFAEYRAFYVRTPNEFMKLS